MSWNHILLNDMTIKLMMAVSIQEARKEAWIRNSCYTVNDKKSYPDITTHHLASVFDRLYGIELQKQGIKYSWYMVPGEQRHLPRINSGYWDLRHTWSRLDIDGRTYYIDPNIRKFNWLYKDKLPDSYVSTKKPKWFYSDHDNLRNIAPLRWFENYTVNIHPFYEEKASCVSLTEYLQYFVWGCISDHIHNIFYKKK